MKKKFDTDFREYISDDPAEIFACMHGGRHEKRLFTGPDSLGAPYTLPAYELLKEANPLKQHYYYIENDEHYAFFTSYENRMNLFTYGKAEWFMDIQTIAYPCSLSCPGFVTDDALWMLKYIKSIKGCKLVLNADETIPVKGMSFGETLPTCRLTLRKEHTTIDNYVKSLRSPYRRRLRLARSRCGGITVKRIRDASTDVHPLYLQTYEKSDYKLECLNKVFFDRADAEKLIFEYDGKAIGFVMLKVIGDELVFMLCGMDYPGKNNQGAGSGRDASSGEDGKAEKCAKAGNADLYYYMLLQIVAYAMEHHCKTIDFGQTSEKTKLKFGATLNKKYFYAHHSNPFLNLFAIVGKGLLEYKYHFPEFHVFKE